MMLKCCVYICSSILSDTNIGYKPLAVAWVTTSSFHITMGVTLLQTEAEGQSVQKLQSFLQTILTPSKSLVAVTIFSFYKSI